jgi:hypothetical protein
MVKETVLTNYITPMITTFTGKYEPLHTKPDVTTDAALTHNVVSSTFFQSTHL